MSATISQELQATEGARVFIQKIKAAQSTPVVHYSINNVGQIINATFETSDQATVQQIAQFIEQHNREARERAVVLR